MPSQQQSFVSSGAMNYPVAGLADVEQERALAFMAGFDQERESREMAEIVHRFRMQTRFIVKALRRWRVRHDMVVSPAARRLSAYEGILIAEDLRQHWRLYKEAMGVVKIFI